MHLSHIHFFTFINRDPWSVVREGGALYMKGAIYISCIKKADCRDFLTISFFDFYFMSFRF